jgi:hypothetical protein
MKWKEKKEGRTVGKERMVWKEKGGREGEGMVTLIHSFIDFLTNELLEMRIEKYSIEEEGKM